MVGRRLCDCRHGGLAVCRCCTGVAHSGRQPIDGVDQHNGLCDGIGGVDADLAHPTGVLATTEIEHRFFGLLVGLVVVFFTKRLIVSLICGVASFAVAVTFF